MHKYTEEEKEWLRRFVPGHSRKEITKEFNKRFGTDINIKTLVSAYKRLGFSTGRTGYFEKGHEPQNKGKKMSAEMYEKCAPTMFKKGFIPPNHKEVGCERVDTKNGYVWVKVKEHCKWQLKQRVVYEKYYGPIPKGYVVRFLDGDIYNFAPENLIAVSRNTHRILNQRHMAKSEDMDLNRTAIKTAELMEKIYEAKRKDD